MKHFYLKFLFLFSGLILCASLSGCWLLINDKDFSKKDIMLKCDDVDGGINRLIDIEGYYSMNTERTSYSIVWDGFGIIFYNDGSCSTLEWKENPPIYLNIPNINLKEHLDEYEHRVLPFIYKGHHYDLCGGLYTIKEDTIVVEFVGRGDFIKELFRIYFKAINRRTLELLEYQEFNKNENKIVWTDRSKQDSISNLVSYVPCKNLPSPLNMYNQHKKYRWNDKKKWKEYHKKRKEYLRMRRKCK